MFLSRELLFAEYQSLSFVFSKWCDRKLKICPLPLTLIPVFPRKSRLNDCSLDVMSFRCDLTRKGETEIASLVNKRERERQTRVFLWWEMRMMSCQRPRLRDLTRESSCCQYVSMSPALSFRHEWLIRLTATKSTSVNVFLSLHFKQHPRLVVDNIILLSAVLRSSM
jgi:hypothetical protein